MIKLLMVLLGTVAFGGQAARTPPARRRESGQGLDRYGGTEAGDLDPAGGPGPGDPGGAPGRPGRPRRPGPARRRCVPRWLTAAAVVALAAWVFRRAVAAIALTALSGTLHILGIGVHLPKVSFAWPWQSPPARLAGTTTNNQLGPWVLQKIEGISRPALGQASFNFVFTHKVSKNIGPLPCWYSSTFYAVGHAAATVDLNPGPAWWGPGTGHYRLRVLARPASGVPGRVAVTMVLPRPQLPQTVHDVTIDNLPSRPLSVQHSWTYPGIACGMVLRPQFPPSVLYAQAQRIAFYRAGHVAAITRPLIATAEGQAVRDIRDNFVQPAVNALGYRLAAFSVTWTARGPGQGAAGDG